jgi:hypothetical protein
MSDSAKPATVRSSEDKQLAEVERARSEGVDLVGPDGLLSGLTKNVWRRVLKLRCLSISAMTDTTRRARTPAPPATAPAPRRCSRSCSESRDRAFCSSEATEPATTLFSASSSNDASLHPPAAT